MVLSWISHFCAAKRVLAVEVAFVMGLLQTDIQKTLKMQEALLQ